MAEKITISDDQITASVSAISAGTKIEDVIELLSQAGVTYGIQSSAILGAIDNAKEAGKPLENVVVAKADPPQPSVPPQLQHQPRGEDGKLEPLAGVARLLAEKDPKAVSAKAKEKPLEALAVTAGELLAVRLLGEVTPGTDLSGNPIDKIREDDLPPQFQPGPGVKLNEATGEFRAEVSGFGGLHEAKVSVIAPVWVTEDHMLAAFLNLPLQAGSAAFTVKDIKDVLEAAGIEEGIREKDVASYAESLAGEGSKRTLVPLASGQRPVQPTDATADFAFATSSQAGVKRKDGSIDLKDRQQFPSVAEGQVLVECKPPEDGIPGVTVRGEDVDVRKAISIELSAGENVKLVEEGIVQKLVSDIDGGASADIVEPTSEDEPIQKISISVRQIAQVAGNVDYDSGNIDFKGNVDIQGSVIGGFTVHATGDIVIGQSVEDGAEISCDGNLEVKQGIVGENTKVEVKGDIKAKFIQDATVKADGGVTAEVYLRTAKVHSGGTITVTGRGETGGILGGETWAQGSIVSNNVGAEGNQTTVLSLGILPDTLEEYTQTQQELVKAKDTKKALLEAIGISVLSKPEIQKALLRNPRKQKEIRVRPESKRAGQDRERLHDPREGTRLQHAGLRPIRQSRRHPNGTPSGQDPNRRHRIDSGRRGQILSIPAGPIGTCCRHHLDFHQRG